MKIYLYNSLTRRIEEFIPITPAEASIYTCGPTVYNFAHIGNLRSFLFADLLQRTIQVIGKCKVKWVMNITNIDDKTIRDSKPTSNAWPAELPKPTGDSLKDLLAFTNYYQQEFIRDIEKLGIYETDFYKMPKATDYINEMQTLITQIVDKGLGYTANGSIYFNVAAYRKTDLYGKLFKIDFDNFQTGLRVDTDQYEREQVSDFVLWKGHKENEPYWDFPLNNENYPGRPGWHIECSAMEESILGLPFDIHTGGIDLKFPHHEDEIAQSKAGYGVEPTNYWCHNEFLEIEGNKMSKSAGNFYTLRDLEKNGIEPIDVRYAMLATHYRTKYNFTFNGIAAARKARLRMQDYIFALLNSHNANIETTVPPTTEKIKSLKMQVFENLANDLHTPKALAHLFSFINNNSAKSLDQPEATDFLSLMLELNAIFKSWNFTETKKNEQQVAIPASIIALAEKRLLAKKDKNYSLADTLRQEIIAAGFNIVDTKTGFEIHNN